ncbi:MAG: hypothetical protein WBP59_02245, partial [Ilumatobacteraceae bacterium]
RMQSAAGDAGRAADPSAATARVASATSSTAASTTTGAALKVVGGLGALGLATGAILGATVLRNDDSAVAAAVVEIDVQSGRTFDCPGGASAGSLQPGDRVFVVGRNDVGDWSALRDPSSIGRTVWIPAESLRPDDDPIEVPVIDCDSDELFAADAPETTETPETTIEDTSTSLPEPTDALPETSTTTTVASQTTTTAPSQTPTTTQGGGVAPVPTPAPTPSPPATAATTTTVAPPPPDTQPPTIGQASASPSEIFQTNLNCAKTSTLAVSAADNIGVTSVTGTFGTVPGSPLAFSLQGGQWRATFGPASGLAQFAQPVVTITITARDAAGNQTSTSTSVKVWGPGWCIE